MCVFNNVSYGKSKEEEYSLDVRASHGKEGSRLVKAKRLHLVCLQERNDTENYT